MLASVRRRDGRAGCCVRPGEQTRKRRPYSPPACGYESSHRPYHRPLAARCHRARSAADAIQRIARIRAEGTEHSQVAPVFNMLTVDIGPRLTASPAHKRAAEWARDRLASYGLENARLEPWKFGRGWTPEKLTVEMVEPRYLPLIGYADGWSASTSGEIVAAPVFIGGKTPEDVDALRAQLKGAIVMTQPIMANFVRKDRPQPSDPELRADVRGIRDVCAGRGGGGRRRGARRPQQRNQARHRDAEGRRSGRDPEAQHRRTRHRVRDRARRRTRGGAVGHAERRALQHDRAATCRQASR